MADSPYPTPDIRRQLTNHPPVSPAVGALFDELTERFIGLGEFLLEHLPSSPERSTAITKLRECSMWSKACAALNQDQITA